MMRLVGQMYRVVPPSLANPEGLRAVPWRALLLRIPARQGLHQGPHQRLIRRKPEGEGALSTA